MGNLFLCLIMMQSFYAEHSGSWNKRLDNSVPHRIDTCISIMEEASLAGLPKNLAASVAWYESKFNQFAESHRGALGPLQAMPKYWCPNKVRKGCDLIKAGLNALKTYIHKYGNFREALCHYNSGNSCVSRSKAYAKKVISLYKKLEFFDGVWKGYVSEN